LRRLPSLFAMRSQVKRRWLAQPPAAFVGIDAPDFNLGLEAALRRRGIPTVHFVGPSIWAWRGERIHGIKEAVSRMLVVFPFEEKIYQDAGVPVSYVGHPLASVIPRHPDRAAARQRLGLPADVRMLALMPGSRRSELAQLGPRFVEAARLLCREDPSLRVRIPMVNAERQQQFEALLAALPPLSTTASAHEPGDIPGWPGWQYVQGGAYDVMEASNAVLVASGTATLEAALFKRPMVIAYVLPSLALWIMKRRSGQTRPYVPWVGLPNVLTQDFSVPELLQEAASPQGLADAVRPMLNDTRITQRLEQRFLAMHDSLLRDTPALAAQAIMEVADRGVA
jgi:lipid-A-disaccharide synthase